MSAERLRSASLTLHRGGPARLHGGHRRRIVAVGALLLAILHAAAVQATGDHALQLALPAQPLATSLAAVAERAGLALEVGNASLEGITAPAVQGERSVDEALDALLAGSGLVAVTDEDRIRVTQVIALPAERAPPPRDEAPIALDEVVVTGELLARTAERAPTSVAVHDGLDIERSTARDVYDVIGATPNAGWHDSELGLSTITLRGIGSYGASLTGAGTLYGTATTIVIDGVALPRGAMGFADLSAFDIDQVEIFRGPQSTSQGRNAMAGAVVINTIEPEVRDRFAPELRGRVGIGNNDAWQAAAAFGATLWPDRLAIRLVTDHRATDGDTDNVTRDEDDWARNRNHGTRLRAKLTPFGPDGPYEVVLGAGDIRRETGNRYVEQAREADREATADEPSGIDNEARLYSVDQRLRLGDEWELSAISAWADSRTLLHLDVDYTARADGFIAQVADSHAFSQELRASFTGEAWRGTLGLFYYRGLDGEESEGSTALSALVDAAGVCPGEALCNLLLRGNVLVDGSAPARIENRALFGEVDWDASQRLTLTAGLRLDHEKNSRRTVSTISGDRPGAQGAVALLKTLGVLARDGETRVGRSFSAVLPKVAASYELFAGNYLGAAYTEGYRPGGDGYNFGCGERYRFDAERTRNVEVSLKGRLDVWRTRYALNLFHTDWDDMQVQLGDLLCQVIGNAGRSRIRGGELELSTRPFRQLRFVGGVGVTDGEFVDFVSSRGDFSGKPLPKAPEYSVTLALEWSPIDSLLIRPEVQRVGSTPAQADNLPENRIPAYTLLNLSLRWQYRALGLFCNGSNLTDEDYRFDANRTALRGDPIAALGHGRRIMAGLEFWF